MAALKQKAQEEGKTFEPPKFTRVCTKCKETGHNARTCKNKTKQKNTDEQGTSNRNENITKEKATKKPPQNAKFTARKRILKARQTKDA